MILSLFFVRLFLYTYHLFVVIFQNFRKCFFLFFRVNRFRTEQIFIFQFKKINGIKIEYIFYFPIKHFDSKAPKCEWTLFQVRLGHNTVERPNFTPCPYRTISLRFSCAVLTVQRIPYCFPLKTAKPRTEPFKTEYTTILL